jgi:hypothetical protein
VVGVELVEGVARRDEIADMLGGGAAAIDQAEALLATRPVAG